MPRTQRKKSETGFYHVISKGNGGQILFENDSDRIKYLKILKESLDDFGLELHAYCLMNNHVHLLLRDANNALSNCMKRLNERYATYFRARTGRIGPVFNGRFWSEPIDSDEYYLAAMRYIHANPEPARICRAADYRWSSYQAFAAAASSFTHTELGLELLGGPEGFRRFQESGCKYAKSFKESKLRGHLSGDELLQIAIAICGREKLNELKSMPPAERYDHLQSLKNSGLSEKQIARIVGIGEVAIHRALTK